MKKCLLIAVNLIMVVQVYCQTYTDKKGNVHLWGELDIEELKNAPYDDWYEKNSKDYRSNLSEDDAFIFKNVKAKVFIGTWCGDTKFLVPKFIKTWNQLGLNENDLQLIGLHNEGDLYKQGPNSETEGLNIHKVPTIIFEKEGKEIGRIVERTIFDLDTDMKQIAMGNPYEERYQAVAMLDQLMQEIDDDSLFIKENIITIYNKIRREVSTGSELNAYGYVLKAQGQDKKAEFVFLMNTYLFKYDPNVHDSYGEMLMSIEQWSEAKKEYEEVLRLKGSDDHAVAQLFKINEALKVQNLNEGE